MRGTTIVIKARDAAKVTHISKDERRRLINETHYIGIAYAHKSKKDYDRKRLKLDTRNQVREYL